MAATKRYSLEEIKEHLKERRYPLNGITRLGTARFNFREPAATIGVALHSGSRVRPEMLEIMEVGREERFREEDPYTDRFVKDFPMQLIALDSRFEYDLNREMEKSIYPFRTKKWGLQVWKRPLTQYEKEKTYQKYREFHELLEMVIAHMLEYSRMVILFDIHSYCYQRDGKRAWWKDEHPEINLGTRYINREYFAHLIGPFLDHISRSRVDGHQIRVAENKVFPGGLLTRKYAKLYGKRVLVLAIEYKKLFMDEHTGKLDEGNLNKLIGDLLFTKDQLIPQKF